ncbi:RNA polymerase subunit AC19 [Kappamyces sp. JEL0680]|nr:RNA polymerase subunit AC19 [Kappamyces sp. JEL0680]
MTEPASEGPNGFPAYIEKLGGDKSLKIEKAGDLQSHPQVDSQADDPSTATFLIEDEGHTLGNAIRWMLMKDPRVQVAGYSIPHPSEHNCALRIQTDGSATAVGVLYDALDNLMEMTRHIKSTFASAIFASVGQAAPPAAPSVRFKNAQSPVRVAERLVATQLLLTRWALETGQRQSKAEPVPASDERYATDDNSRATQAFSALQKTLSHPSVSDILTAKEREWMLTKKLGSWDLMEDLYPVELRWESLGMLCWALRIFREIPAYDDYFPREAAYTATAIVPAFPQTIDSFLEYFSSGEGTSADHFVTPADLKREIDIAEAWVWRAKAQKVLDLKLSLSDTDSLDVQVALKKIPKQLKTVMEGIQEAIALGAERAQADGLLLSVVDGDFGLSSGKKYSEADDHQIRDMGRVAESRLAALGWMCGSHKDWEWTEGELQFVNPLGSLWTPQE